MERPDAELERVTLAKVTARLIPFMFVLYLFNILDRVNVSIAVLTMKPDLTWLSDSVYGMGAGIFFVGYFFFEVPSNIMLERLGARLWMARIMVTWGIVAACMMLVHSPTTFYATRFLLGVAEAGFFPGMMLYLTYWFPNSFRGQAAAKFILANVFANIIGGPIGAQFLKLNGLMGLRGWQWLFLLEGIPSVLLGLGIFFYLTDRPERAAWLKRDEREWLVARLAREQEHRQKYHHMSLIQAFGYPRVLHLSAMFFLNIMAGAGMGFFANLVLKQRSGWSDQTVLWVSAVPNILGAAAMLLSATYSDRLRERRLFVAAGLFIAAAGVTLCAGTKSAALTLAGLCVLTIGTNICNAPFWALTTGFLSGAAAAGGIAFINSVGNSGSFFGPLVMGWLKDQLSSYEPGLYVLACIFALGSWVAFRLPPDPAQAAEQQEAVPAH